MIPGKRFFVMLCLVPADGLGQGPVAEMDEPSHVAAVCLLYRHWQVKQIVADFQTIPALA